MPDPKPWRIIPSVRIAFIRVKAIEWRKPGILTFFKFGTAPAQCLVSSGMVSQTPKFDTETHNWSITMTNITNNLFAAAFSIVISASLFAYAIVPASPTLMA